MSVTYEPDWDAGTENAYDEHRARHSSGMCVICRDDEALPNDEVCAYCLDEINAAEVDE